MAHDLVALAGALGLVDDLYDRYREDPKSVDPSWRALFANGHLPAPRASGASVAHTAIAATQSSEVGIWRLVDAYRTRGHLAASIDPLGIMVRGGTSELSAATYGFSDSDLDREVAAPQLHALGAGATLREVLEHLRIAYCDTVGLEFTHIQSPVKQAWLADRMERRSLLGPPDGAIRIRMLEQLIASEAFETFIHTKFPGTKRFSLEGGESMIPLLDEVIENAGRHGAIEIVIGMAHRGRLNVLVQTVGRRPKDIFNEFQDIEPESTLGGGDVKYHLGFSCDHTDRSGNVLHLSLAYNPSHLEAVDPVVVGRVRAKQRRHGDWDRSRTVGVLVHGDAAFAGQGLVAEVLNLSNLHGYRTGGTVHIIVNNQIGFTASPKESRSTPYCTDVAKMIQCPIWHVNGEDLDAVARVVEMAMEYRSKFQNDVVIDMLCYRKFGHNEMDEPSFTQPQMYKRIQQKKPIHNMYGERLVADGVITEEQVSEIRKRSRAQYDAELEAAKATDKRPVLGAMGGVWTNYVGGPEDPASDCDTGVSLERLREISELINTPPEGVVLHPKVKRLFERRLAIGRGEQRIDWGMGELLSYGSLLWDGVNIRLSGQDSSRGTFSHRHSIVTDIETGTEHMLLGQLHPEQGDCRIYDSPLSEAGVLGFEFGYSLDYPDGLVMWEAQFGDFVNGAQVIIDQFIMSSEDKWNRLSGLVMLLPHGYEGQGPEHSSARLERFLENAAEDNVQIVQPTTPAQMFHLLRRQVVRSWRKPLIVLSPKSLLRLPAAGSTLDELGPGTRFHRVLGDPGVPAADAVDRVFFCSGRIYYDLIAEREKRGDQRTAILRIEQLYPWQPEEVKQAALEFDKAVEFVWVQDEPGNMGARTFLLPRLSEIFGRDLIRTVQREDSASPATGSSKAHAIEQRELLNEAFGD